MEFAYNQLIINKLLGGGKSPLQTLHIRYPRQDYGALSWIFLFPVFERRNNEAIQIINLTSGWFRSSQ